MHTRADAGDYIKEENVLLKSLSAQLIKKIHFLHHIVEVRSKVLCLRGKKSVHNMCIILGYVQNILNKTHSEVVGCWVIYH